MPRVNITRKLPLQKYYMYMCIQLGVVLDLLLDFILLTRFLLMKSIALVLVLQPSSTRTKLSVTSLCKIVCINTLDLVKSCHSYVCLDIFKISWNILR